jgi:phosphorylcholine metabolism protein LicD/glycosyltransferase involved in cell wall biosynthesis
LTKMSSMIDRRTEAVLNADTAQDNIQEKSPRLSFIVPVYNVEQHLARCLDSLVGQTFQDIEIIVVNDGSPDNSQEIINRYAEEYPSLVRPFEKPNGGLSDARNFGLEYARGEYVVFVDSDDYVSKELAEKTLAKAAEHDADIVGFRLYQVTHNRLRIQKNNYIDQFQQGGCSVVQNPSILLAARPYAWNKIYRKKLFFENNIRYPVGQHYEDSATTYNLLLMANRIDFVNEPFYFYIIDRPDSITNVVDHRIYDVFKSVESFMTFYKAHGAYEICKNVLDELARTFIFARLVQILSVANEEFAIQFIDDAYEKLNNFAPNWNKNPYYWLAKVSWLSKRKRLYVLRSKASFYKFYYRVHQKRLRKNAMKRANKQPPSMETVQKLQDIQLGILAVVDRFCRRHNLTYYLAEGTLLGAVRHEGFIPWDDDVDIVMPRKDYEKFISLFDKQEIENCVMLNQFTYSKYYLTFTKIAYLEKTGFVNRLDRFPNRFSGPSIDIFPLDHGVEKEDPKRVRKIRFYRDILLYKSRYMRLRGHKRIRQLPFFVQWFFSYKKLHQIIRDLYTQYNELETGYLTNFASSYRVSKETFPKEAFAEQVEAKFGDQKFFIPSDAETVLSRIYGNWKKLPPENRQIPRHSLCYEPKFDPREDEKK